MNSLSPKPKPVFALILLPLVLFVGLPGPAHLVAQTPESPAMALVTEKDDSGTAVRVKVTIDQRHFTTLHFRDGEKPYLHPVLGPGQTRMTRDFPLAQTAGEANDHPHHKSIWIGHQINGIDFWTNRSGSKIAVPRPPQIDAKNNLMLVTSNWTDAKGNITCSDTTTWKFGSSPGLRFIDCQWTLLASHGPLTIDDTKEGTVAIRTHPDLRLKPDPKRGVDKVFGSATNSKKITGPKIWGQPASWVLYSGTVESKPTSLLILDHPTNFRHPTTWHARDYGLVAANPFGLHALQGMDKRAGEVKLATGQSLTLRYRFCFFDAKIDTARCEQELKTFTNN